VVEHLVSRPHHEGALDRLTPKERRVLALMAEGRSNRGIAEDLVVTVPAVERHVTSIFNKLELQQAPDQHRRVLAVRRYLELCNRDAKPV
jgi:DNA-binding NarL/FixJ family response regulator